MSFTLNTLWLRFNRVIQANVNTDIPRKIDAINAGQSYLLNRMIELAQGPDDFLQNPANASNVINTNYVSTPNGFISLHKLWRLSGSQYIQFGKAALITYDDLLERVGQTFFDTSVNGDPILAAVKEPRIYFDQHFNNVFSASETITGATSGATATISTVESITKLTLTSVSGTFQAGEVITGGTTGTTATIDSVDSGTQLTITRTGGTKSIKLSYWKTPTEAVAYDRLTVTSVSGTFQDGEIIEGGTSSSSSTIYATNISDGAGTIDINTNGRDGSFSSGETITGATSGATATLSGDLSEKPQTLDWSDKYLSLLAEACALWWLHMKGSNEVQSRSVMVDNMITMQAEVNRHREYSTWSIV